MIARIQQIRRWLAPRDSDLSILVAITLVCLLARWIFAIGTALPDDPGYACPLGFIFRGEYPSLGAQGQAEFRPAWLLPIGASLRWLGWTAHGMVLYPIITGGFLPLLTALWLRRNLPRGSQAPVVCAVILACYPVLFVDSLMWVIEVPLIFWCLLCVNLFGCAYAGLAESPLTARKHLSWIGFSILAGAAFSVAYQVKITALPLLGIWLTTEVLLQVERRGWPARRRWIALLLAAAVFLLPSLGVQLFYQAKTGHFFGNIQAEMRMYAVKLPENYLNGNLRLHDLYLQYVEQLLLPFGPAGFRVLLHGIWMWVALGLGVAAGVLWRRLPAPERTMAFVFFFSALGLFLFLEFWPFRLRPHYLPISFDGRPWRYTDVLAPPIAAFTAVVLTLPGVFDRWLLGALRCGLLGTCLGIAGYGMVIRYHQFEDSTADYRQAAVASTTWLKSYCRLPQVIDEDGCEQFTEMLGWPDKTSFQPSRSRFLDLRNSPPVCIWTGGARREAMSADAAWSPDRMKLLGGDVVLIHTFAGLRRPWRSRLLQLWLFRPTKVDSHDPPSQP